MIFVIAVAGYVAALIAISRFRDSESRYTRTQFSWYAVPYLFPWVFGITSDVLMLYGVKTASLSANTNPTAVSFDEFFITYCALFAYPLFRQMMGRLRDSGLSRIWAYAGLIPGLNLLVIIMLMCKPSIDGIQPEQ
jgi:uncharacterized membrane protein YhaH (DUF805 family)